jgi:hypothetical protein
MLPDWSLPAPALYSKFPGDLAVSQKSLATSIGTSIINKD